MREFCGQICLEFAVAKDKQKISSRQTYRGTEEFVMIDYEVVWGERRARDASRKVES